MAQSKHCPYSFYVPENDAQLMRFVKSQSNLSLSVRLLMKAFLSAYKGEIQDVAAADLSDLISGVRLENIPGLQAAVPAEDGRSGQEAYEEAGEQAPGTAPSADAADGKPAAGSSAGPAVHEADAGTEPAGEEEEYGPGTADTSGGSGQDEQEPVPVPEVVEEPERPVKTVDSERAAYNESRLPSKKATEDDLMAMMGEGF